jgi:DNA-binding response OmpR family regulator
MTATILIIEDDVPLSELFQLMLTRAGFRTEVANDARTGLQKMEPLEPDAVVLDIVLPDIDGWQVCTQIKESYDVPIIMLTILSSPDKIVKGLELGADDYLVKPVSPAELVARLRAVLRRAPRSPGTNRNEVLTHNNLKIDVDKHTVTLAGEQIDLSPTEFRLLSVLVRNAGRVLPQDFLLTEVWGPEHRGEIERLRTYINYLRRKLDKDAFRPSGIHNVWGVGYLLD